MQPWKECIFLMLLCSVMCQLDRNSRNMRNREDMESIFGIYKKFSKYFDKRYPSPTMIVKRNNVSIDMTQPDQLPYSPNQLTTMHGKRCIALDNSQAVLDFSNEKWKELRFLNNLPILITTPCLGSDSLGNYLGSYFENIMCAEKAKLHYFGVSPIWEPSTYDEPSFYLSAFPTFIEHKKPSLTIEEAKMNMKMMCKCPGSCHERPNALWIQGLDLIKTILSAAITSHMNYLEVKQLQYTKIVENDLATVSSTIPLPLIPEAAIHYRCGDNFVGHYGFLPFKTFTQYIPKNVTSIYVLAEQRSRKTKNKESLASKCDAAFGSLFQYLKHHFPNSIVLIKRGDNLYTDIIRLSLAKYTICSVSTFCLWPAIVNPNHAYFPKTKLIVGGNTNIQLGFEWILSPSIILGQSHAMTQPKQFVQLLNG